MALSETLVKDLAIETTPSLSNRVVDVNVY